MASENITLYIKGDRNVEVTEQDVFLKDIVSMECSDKKFLPKLQTVKILKLHGNREQRYVVSVLEIIACIHAAYPEVEVQNLGEADIIVTYENQKTPPYLWHILKVAVVAAIIFLGSAFSIMAFNNDVGVTKLFGQIYELVMGKKSDGFTVLEVTYSIGLTFGILIFFNHFGKKRFTVDPTPMEVQMRLYENDIQTALVENASRRKEELEVGDR
ncbi:MAG: stage V sporulation protein AA [Blautia obeum]|nr:stage V sporulation protein AA [Blautia obeum]